MTEDTEANALQVCRFNFSCQIAVSRRNAKNLSELLHCAVESAVRKIVSEHVCGADVFDSTLRMEKP